MPRGQAERLFPLLDELLAEAGAGWADLTCIGVGIGPGNFTGIRISVAAARGLALSLSIPAIGVTVTEAATLDAARPCRALVPGRAGQVFWQDFGPDGPLTDPAEGTEHALPPGPPRAEPTQPLAVAIARLAARRHVVTVGHSPTIWPRPAPVYLRPPDAAPPRDPGPVILP